MSRVGHARIIHSAQSVDAEIFNYWSRGHLETFVYSVRDFGMIALRSFDELSHTSHRQNPGLLATSRVVEISNIPKN